MNHEKNLAVGFDSSPIPATSRASLSTSVPLTEHTPGPWFVRFPRIIADDARETIVCSVTGAPSNPAAQADARLIAAAPDLLRQLQHLARLLESALNNGQAQVPGLATLNGAWLAIAKATGSK